MTDALETYCELRRALGEAGITIAAAEFHGGLCGTLCAGGDAAARAWLEQCLDEGRAAPERLAALRERLLALGQRTRAALDDDALSFAPCLPGEDEHIGERAEALALWCHGFLAGLGLGGVDLGAGVRPESAEINEIVADIAEISKASAAGGEGDEDAEDGFALAELTEYVRVGVQYVYEVLNHDRGARATVLH